MPLTLTINRQRMCEMNQTIKSQCPICRGVIESVPIKMGVKVMMACPHCHSHVILEIEERDKSTEHSKQGEKQ